MDNVIFVTGTDTDAGKTVISCALIEYYVSQGVKVAPFKPVSAGAVQTENGLRNSDAVQLLSASKSNYSYNDINPFVYEEPVAPHIAAEKTGHPISSALLTQRVKSLSMQSDLVVIEGAGGWQVPLNKKESLADWVRTLECPVILVVGLRVGCINHAVLSYLEIINGPNKLIGWIANTTDSNVDNVPAIIDYIGGVIKAPLLGAVPYLKENDTAVEHIDFSLINTTTAQ